LSYDVWQRFSIFSLGNEILEHSTFVKMKDTLLRDDTDIRQAVKLLRSDFLTNFDPVNPRTQMDLASFLAAEGVLTPGEYTGTFKISSPLVRWLILQRIIPRVFPTSPQTEVPYHSSRTLDILEALKQIVVIFDKEIIRSLSSYKTACVAVNSLENVTVPRESVYDAELYRIMTNWFSEFIVTGQWHLKYRANGHVNHKYIDIVISRPGHPTIALELLATATKKELNEHYERALTYTEKLSADETWVVHFTCCEASICYPCWPTAQLLVKGLRVVIFWHDLGFTKIRMRACWWDSVKLMKHISQIEELTVRYITNFLVVCFRIL
jgi:hypothetical protein